MSLPLISTSRLKNIKVITLMLYTSFCLQVRYRLRKFDNGNYRWYLKLSVLSQNQRFCWYLYQEKVCVCIWGFTVRQHLRSLAPVMNGYWWLWWPNDIGGSCGPKASWHLSQVRKTRKKNLTQETCPDQGSNLGPLRDRCACYSACSTAVDTKKKECSLLKWSK